VTYSAQLPELCTCLVALCAIRKTCTGLFGSCIAGVTNPVSLLAYLKESINYVPSLLEGENLKKTRQHDRYGPERSLLMAKYRCWLLTALKGPELCF